VLSSRRRGFRTETTLDADFHLLLALSHATLPSVIRVRIEGLRAVALADLLESVLKKCSEDLASGAAVTVQLRRLRVRRLPLIG
jgi:predicted nuclease of predicted toxin-antitoxin system